jgi:hypothetical protein
MHYHDEGETSRRVPLQRAAYLREFGTIILTIVGYNHTP